MAVVFVVDAAAEAVPQEEHLEEEEAHLAEAEVVAGVHPEVEDEAAPEVAEEALVPVPGSWSSHIRDLRVFTFWLEKTKPFAQRI